jgi:hypothetical protein
LPPQGIFSLLQFGIIALILLLHSLHNDFETVETVVITQDVLEELMPLDLAVIANGIHQLHLLTELSQSDDRGGDVFNLIGLEVKGKIQTHVPRLIA